LKRIAKEQPPATLLFWGAAWVGRGNLVGSVAFAAACKARHRAGQPPVGYEVIARRIVEAARAGERDLKRLTEAALVARPKNKRD
jgi:hypothetical protein